MNSRSAAQNNGPVNTSIPSQSKQPQKIDQPPTLGASYNRKKNLARAEALLADEDDLN
jgi:hypothetical protein